MDSYQLVGHESGLKKIRFVSWITNPNLKRFGWYRDHESSQFSKDSTCFHESNESLQILSTMARNESLKIEIRIVDLFRKKKIPKLLDSFRFGRIRTWIPYPWTNLSLTSSWSTRQFAGIFLSFSLLSFFLSFILSIRILSFFLSFFHFLRLEICALLDIYIGDGTVQSFGRRFKLNLRLAGSL